MHLSSPLTLISDIVGPHSAVMFRVVWVFENMVLRRIFGPRRDEVWAG